jgi:hypothetical protein
MANLCPLKPLS